MFLRNLKKFNKILHLNQDWNNQKIKVKLEINFRLIFQAKTSSITAKNKKNYD